MDNFPHYLDKLTQNLYAVLDTCAAAELWRAANALVWVFHEYLEVNGYATDWKRVLETGVTAAQKLGDRHDEGSDLGNLGNAYRDLGQVERAIEYHAQALAIRREIGDRRGEGNRLGNLEIAYSDLGQVERAKDCLRQCLAIFEAIKDPLAMQVRRWLADLG